MFYRPTNIKMDLVITKAQEMLQQISLSATCPRELMFLNILSELLLQEISPTELPQFNACMLLNLLPILKE